MTVRQIAARVRLPPPEAASAPRGPHRSAFADLLQRAHAPPGVAVSATAAEQLAARGLALDGPLAAQLATALDTLASAGARDALVVGPDAAFVAHVPDRTIATVHAPDDLRRQPLTGLDSVLYL